GQAQDQKNGRNEQREYAKRGPGPSNWAYLVGTGSTPGRLDLGRRRTNRPPLDGLFHGLDVHREGDTQVRCHRLGSIRIVPQTAGLPRLQLGCHEAVTTTRGGRGPLWE